MELKYIAATEHVLFKELAKLKGSETLQSPIQVKTCNYCFSSFLIRMKTSERFGMWVMLNVLNSMIQYQIPPLYHRLRNDSQQFHPHHQFTVISIRNYDVIWRNQKSQARVGHISLKNALNTYRKTIQRLLSIHMSSRCVARYGMSSQGKN